tara:strand:+ start:1822 stop:2019 length:198 start_codon:yes stop_codon:yes gene_type:complete
VFGFKPVPNLLSPNVLIVQAPLVLDFQAKLFGVESVSWGRNGVVEMFEIDIVSDEQVTSDLFAVV